MKSDWTTQSVFSVFQLSDSNAGLVLGDCLIQARSSCTLLAPDELISNMIWTNLGICDILLLANGVEVDESGDETTFVDHSCASYLQSDTFKEKLCEFLERLGYEAKDAQVSFAEDFIPILCQALEEQHPNLYPETYERCSIAFASDQNVGMAIGVAIERREF